MTDQRVEALLSEGLLDSRLRWHCEPKKWYIDSSRRCLVIQPDTPTDFWRKTHYGFDADNGHFLFVERCGDFVLTTHVCSQPAHQYDQAGLMIRHSADCWLKTSVEFSPDEAALLGAVVTNYGYSDWSTQDFPSGQSDVWLRVCRCKSDYTVEYSDQGLYWTPIRVAHLHEDPQDGSVQCGIYACSPKGEGYIAEFTSLELQKTGT